MTRQYIRHEYWDSLLDTSHASARNNANLDIIVRTFLRRYDPEGGTGTFSRPGRRDNEPVVAWTDQQWTDWKRDFKRVLEDGIQGAGGWNNRFWMVPNRSWEPQRATASGGMRAHHIHNIRCCLRIDLVDDENRAHLKLHVKRLAPDNEQATSSMQLASQVDRDAENYGHLDHRDLSFRDTPRGQRQIPVMHEFGHYLGLDHVARRGNDNAAYAIWPAGTQPTRAQSHQVGDLMGAGMRMEPWHARPWVRRIPMHIGRQARGASAVEWRVTTARPEPQFVPAVTRRAPSPAGGVGMGRRDGGV